MARRTVSRPTPCSCWSCFTDGRAALRAVACDRLRRPRHSAHSQGFGACEEDGANKNVGGSVTRHRAEARADPLAER